MPTGAPTDHVVAGRNALQTGDYDAAARLFEAALDDGDLAAAHDGLGQVAFLADDFEVARTRWEHAHRLYRDEGDLRAAALVATYLAAVYFDGFMNEAASQGWLGRAERLLDTVGRCVERGYFALALVACDVRNATQLEQSAAVALELAQEYSDPTLEALALANAGLALINQGRIAAGFAKLDESMAAVSAGEVVPFYGSKIFCALLTSCERTGDLRRAQDWSDACRVFLQTQLPGGLPILHSHCRVAYGTVLCDSGQWDEGESEILQALGPSASRATIIRANGVAALAGLRLMQGRIDEAARLLEPYADTFEVCEQMATVHLLRGEHDLAVAVIGRGLDELVGDRLRAGRLLALLVEAELARGDVERADLALERLIGCAESSDSAVLDATTKLAEARIAAHRSKWAEAAALLAGAARALRVEQRPALAGRIRFELAAALAATGDAAGAGAEARSALSVFERLGATRDVEDVTAFLRDLAASAAAVPAD